jgi:hypothetical protein
LEYDIVDHEIQNLLAKHEDTLKRVVSIQFDIFKNTNVVQNPNVTEACPSLLLTGLDASEESELSSINPTCDLLLDVAISGLGKTRAYLQELSQMFGSYFIPSCITTDNGDEQYGDDLKYHFGPRDFECRTKS